MRLRKRLFSEIAEYLRLNFTGGAPEPYYGDKRLEPVDRSCGAVCEDSSPVVREDSAPPVPSAPRAAAPPRFQSSAPSTSVVQPRRKAAARIYAEPDRTNPPCPAPTYRDLNDRLNTLDESFQEALLRLIDERKMKDSACYKRAGVDRKLFSKIRSNPQYRPSKPTAVAFAIALELSLDETADLLRKVGYALSHSSKFDVIVEYFILNRRYSLRELNEALYEFDQPLIG